MTQPTVLGSIAPDHRAWFDAGLISGWPGDADASVGRWPGDATYGWDYDALMTPGALPPAPDDFPDFWHTVALEAESLPSSLRIERAVQAPPELAHTHRVHEASYESIAGRRIGCWVVLPIEGEPTLNLTVGHGYGGRSYPDLVPWLLRPRDAAILPCLRGLPELSLGDDIPDGAQRHVLHGLDSPQTSALRGCVADLWRATAELDHLVGVHRRAYHGGSFGGGLGAFALMGGRYARAALHVPTFGNHPLRVTLPSVGSGAALTQRWREDPTVLDVLAYFDAATAASHVHTPTLVSIALWDPAVPPPGQVAVHHALQGEKQLVVQDCGHTPFPGEPEQEERWRALVADWIHA